MLILIPILLYVSNTECNVYALGFDVRALLGLGLRDMTLALASLCYLLQLWKI